MRPKVKRVKTEASQLHGATAGFVSLVDRGANETPFRVVKSKNGATGKNMPIKKRKSDVTPTKSAKSHKALGSSKKGKSAVKTEKKVASLVYSGDVFDDVAEVQEALAKSDWEGDIEITQNADGDFVAREAGFTDDDFSKIAKVATDEEGVEAFIGLYTVPDDDDDDDDDDDVTASVDDDDDDADDVKASASKPKIKSKPVSKRAAFLKKREATKVTKFDIWDANYSGGGDISTVLKDGMSYDGVPPGVSEVMFAFNKVTSNILKSEDSAEDKKANLTKAADEVAALVSGLDVFFEAFVGADEATVSKAAGDSLEHLSKWADDYADYVNGEEVQAPTVVNNSIAAPVVIDYSKIVEAVSSAVDDKLAPISADLEEVQSSVKAFTDRKQVSRAIDPEATTKGLEEEDTTAEADAAAVADRQNKSILG